MGVEYDIIYSVRVSILPNVCHGLSNGATNDDNGRIHGDEDVGDNSDDDGAAESTPPSLMLRDWDV